MTISEHAMARSRRADWRPDGLPASPSMPHRGIGLDRPARALYVSAREIGAVSRGGRPVVPILPAIPRGYDATARSGTGSAIVETPARDPHGLKSDPIIEAYQ
jgi:hypothetical protein